jgi:hypothetical protein
VALPTLADVKLYLKKQSTDEDVLLQSLLDRAYGLVTAYLGRPYYAVETTWIDEGGRVRAYGGLRSLSVPMVPFDPATLTIEDADGDALVLVDDYRAPNHWDSVVRAAVGMSFTNPPYTLTATVGLSVSTNPDYSTVIEPTIATAVIDTVAAYYQQRNPGASSESTGGGVSTSWDTKSGLPTRVCAALSPFAALRIV